MISLSRYRSFASALRSPQFLVALGVLFLNDFFLKSAYPSWITGKLSDFAGLYAFAVFLIALRPARRNEITLGVALFFVWWKSPLSQSAIDAANVILPFTIARVVDATDLLALVVLPFALYHYPSKAKEPQRWATATLACASLFLFCATSVGGISYKYDTEYYFRQSVPELERDMTAIAILPDTNFEQENTFTWPGDTAKEFYGYYNTYKLHPDTSFEAYLHPASEGDGSRSVLELRKITIGGHGYWPDRALAKQEFEAQVIDRLPGFIRSKRAWHMPSFRPGVFDFMMLIVPFGISLLLIGFAVIRLLRKKPSSVWGWILYVAAALCLVFWIGYFVSTVYVID